MLKSPFVPIRPALITACALLPLFTARAEILTPPDIITFSTEFSGQYAALNVFDGDATDFASQGAGLDTFLEFQFTAAQTFDRIVVMNRDSPARDDWVGDFTLTLNDAATVSVTREAKRGVSGVHSLGSPVTAAKVRLDVDTLGTGGPVANNTGAMEIFFIKTPEGSVPVDSLTVTEFATLFNVDYAAATASRPGFLTLQRDFPS
ncbi:MAG: hypothetical protein JWM59_912 [Verrucomicrobiales bacterium]|nr:hypothetical protein [Verrucomicrobiales bacterium]